MPRPANVINRGAEATFLGVEEEDLASPTKGHVEVLPRGKMDLELNTYSILCSNIIAGRIYSHTSTLILLFSFGRRFIVVY